MYFSLRYICIFAGRNVNIGHFDAFHRRTHLRVVNCNFDDSLKGKTDVEGGWAYINTLALVRRNFNARFPEDGRKKYRFETMLNMCLQLRLLNGKKSIPFTLYFVAPDIFFF